MSRRRRPNLLGRFGSVPTALSRLVIAAGMASLLDSAAIITVGTALPLWRSHLRLDDWTVGAISASFTFALAVGALLGGRAADLLGRARTFSATVAFYAIGAGSLALAQSAPAVVAGAILLGAAAGADLPASIALVAERSPAPIRGRMVASTQVMWGIGILLATFMGLTVSTFGVTGIRMAFVTLALTALGTLAARRRVMRHADQDLPAEEPAPPHPQHRTGHHRRANRRLLALIAVFYVVYTLVSNTFGSFRTYFLVVVGDASQTTATAIGFGITILGLSGSLIFARIADGPWRGRVFPLGAASLVGAQVILAISGGEPLAAAILAFAMYALAFPYVGEGLYKVWSQEVIASDLRATFQGTTIALARTAAAAFALVTPTLLSWSASGLFWILAGAAAVASMIGWRITRLMTENLRDAESVR